jgi:hypothetical protein
VAGWSGDLPLCSPAARTTPTSSRRRPPRSCLLEITAGAPTQRGKPAGQLATRERMRKAECESDARRASLRDGTHSARPESARALRQDARIGLSAVRVEVTQRLARRGGRHRRRAPALAPHAEAAAGCRPTSTASQVQQVTYAASPCSPFVEVRSGASDRSARLRCSVVASIGQTRLAAARAIGGAGSGGVPTAVSALKVGDPHADAFETGPTAPNAAGAA